MATVVVSYVPGTAYQTRVEGVGFSLAADEPVTEGGTGLGPSPYELLLAALGHCSILTIVLYGRRKGWAVRDVTIRSTHERVITEAEDERSRRKVERIVQEIRIEGDLDEGQLARLLDIAGKCPVHRTLTGDIEIADVAVQQFD